MCGCGCGVSYVYLGVVVGLAMCVCICVDYFERQGAKISCLKKMSTLSNDKRIN